jgi:hypothetical protein
VFDWLFEGRIEIYSLLSVVAVLLLLVWWRTRKRGVLVAAGVVAALAGVYFVLSLLVETPHAQVTRKLNEMAAGVKARDADAIFKHIAADLRFRGQDRAAFRNYVETALRRGLIGELEVWDFHWPKGGDEKTLPVEFSAKPKGGVVPDGAYYLVRAKFVREADGQWRLQSFDVYNPAVETSRPIDIPTLP